MFKNNIDTIEVELTQACVLKCKHCFLNKVAGPMTQETFENVLLFIKETFEVSSNDTCEIIFTGGEPGLFNLDTLSKGIDWLKKQIHRPIKIYFQTSLVYDITEKHLEVFKKVSELSTSWDYLTRFDSLEKEAKFFANLEKLKKENINVHLIVTITDELVKNVTPEMFISFIMATGIKGFDFNRLFTPAQFTNEQYSKLAKAKAKDMREWLFKAYKIWDKIKDSLGIFVFDFEGITSSYYGIHYNQWSKSCPETLVHIMSTGKVTNCHNGITDCFGDVNTKEYNLDKYQKVITTHQNYYESEECKTCKYFNYCQCGCPWMYHDETGCTVPYKVYDYLKLKRELEEMKKR